MSVKELLEGFSNPDVIMSLSASDKILAGLVTTLLGMGITFTALIILQFIISWMDKILNKDKEAIKHPRPEPPNELSLDTIQKERSLQDDNELIAVIAGVIAMKMKTSVENIVIKNIERLDNHSPAWNQAGIIEQMNSRI